MEGENSRPDSSGEPAEEVAPAGWTFTADLSRPATDNPWAWSDKGLKRSTESTKKEVLLHIYFSLESAKNRTLNQHVSSTRPFCLRLNNKHKFMYFNLYHLGRHMSSAIGRK